MRENCQGKYLYKHVVYLFTNRYYTTRYNKIALNLVLCSANFFLNCTATKRKAHKAKKSDSCMFSAEDKKEEHYSARKMTVCT